MSVIFVEEILYNVHHSEKNDMGVENKKNEKTKKKVIIMILLSQYK